MITSHPKCLFVCVTENSREHSKIYFGVEDLTTYNLRVAQQGVKFNLCYYFFLQKEASLLADAAAIILTRKRKQSCISFAFLVLFEVGKRCTNHHVRSQKVQQHQQQNGQNLRKMKKTFFLL